jgi:hypothetical protein
MSEGWGPWSASMPEPERRRAVLVLKTLASIVCGRRHPLYKALLRADMAGDDARGAQALALLEAGIELERLPALKRRQLISSYAGNMLVADDAKTPRHARAKPKGAEAAA